jgi:fucose permease
LFCLAFVLFLSLPLWRKNEAPQEAVGRNGQSGGAFISNTQALRIPGIKYALIAFLCYCGCELSTGLWAASYLVEQKGLTGATAAAWASLYYGGITAGRFVSGFVSIRLRGPQLIRLGCSICLAGVVTLLIPLPAICSLFGFVLIGLGCAPFYPAMIHETPLRFGAENSQAAMGLQMASAYVGSTFLPPLAGALSKQFTLYALPWLLFALVAGMFFFSERVTRVTRAGSTL